MGKHIEFQEVYHIPVHDWLLGAVMCEQERTFINSEELNGWADKYILPILKRQMDDPDLIITANHVHIGDEGVEPHDHLPHLYTSVLFLVDAEGLLILHRPNGTTYAIKPEKGKLVFFKADQLHHVEPSPEREFRVTFVSNYGYPTAKPF